MKKVLVTVSFVVDGLQEEDLGGFVGGVEEGLRKGIANSLANAPSGMTRDQAMTAAAAAIEFYGATITLQRPLFLEQEV